MTSSKGKLIVIVGATGVQGGSVLGTFLQNPGYRIRALSRNPTSEKAQQLTSRSANIEVVKGDLSDVDSLKSAFQGATSIFLVTNWIANYEDLARRGIAPPTGQSLNQVACQIETQQAQNVFDVAAGIETLERLVFSNLSHVSKLSNGKYNHGYHFDSKAIAVAYLQSNHPGLWEKTSLIQMGVYLENFVNFPIFQPYVDSKTNEVVFQLIGKEPESEMAWPFVAAEEDTGPIVQALVDHLPPKQHVLANRGMMPFEDFVRIFEETTGRKARAECGREITGFPDEMKVQIEDVFAFAREFGFYGGDETVTTLEKLDAEIKLGTLREWIEKQDWSALSTK